MIGLKRELDRLPQPHKSNIFSTKLQGRFFVAGQSGSLAKHFEKLDNDRKFKASSECYDKKVEIQILQDTQKLQKIEHDWNEMKKQRLLKFAAAAIIQRCANRFLYRKKSRATHVIVNCLEFLLAKQTIQAASVALKIIKSFLTCFLYKARLRRKKAATILWSAAKGKFVFYVDFFFIIIFLCLIIVFFNSITLH